MKTLHLVEAWNTYNIDRTSVRYRTGKYITYKFVMAGNHTEATNIIQKETNERNKLYKDRPNLQVNFLTCNGHIRTI